MTIRSGLVVAAVLGVCRSDTLAPPDFLNTHHWGEVDVAGDRSSSLTIKLHLPGRNRTIVTTTRPHNIFADNFSATHTDKHGVTRPVAFETNRFHVGTVAGDPNSLVHFHVRADGLVDGMIHTAGEQLHIEPEQRYGSTLARAAARRARALEGTEMKPQHLVFSYHDIKPAAMDKVGDYCGVTHDNRRSMQRGDTAGTPRHPRSPIPLTPPGRYARTESNTDCRVTSGNCDCTMALIADQYFLATEYAENSPAIAMQYMVNMAINSNSIYRGTSFSGYTGFGFAIATVAIDESSSLNAEITDATALLEVFSQASDWSSYCQAHLFTDRDFSGTLGLAYIGTLCSSSDNTGFHSSYGVPSVVQMLTFTHEIGHGWGANHDTTEACSPGNDNSGNFIMYPSATDGSRSNNMLFSTCSTAEMTSSLQRVSCFVQATAHCGNGIVEEGEDCDCGAECGWQSCCTSSCTVNTNAGYTCSPQDPIRFPCCTPEDGSANQCQFVLESAEKVCDDEDNCDAEAKCTGAVASCPLGDPFPQNTECECINDDCRENPNTGPKLCDRGLCNVSRCALTSAAQCNTQDCDLSCAGSGWGNGTQCVSTYDEADRHPNQTYGLHVASGHTCDDYLGYCNARGECMSVGTDLAQKWSAKGAAFFTSYWWALMIALALFYGIHLGVRRLYRVKRRDGYESIGPTVMGAGHRFNTDSASARDGFEQALMQDDSSDDSDGPDSEAEDQQVVDHYERERRSVIFTHYSESFAAAPTEADLEALGGQLKETIVKGHLDQHRVIELRVVYTDRLNVLRGFPADKDQLKASFDKFCGAVDSARSESSKLWHTTKKSTKASIKKFKKEVENQDFIYY